MEQSRLDELWAKHIGSRRIVMGQELEALTKLRKEATLPFKDIYALYLSSKWWKKMRRDCLAHDGNKCVKCGSTVMLHVDHLKYCKFGKEKIEDLQTLCFECHKEKTHKYDLGANTVPAKRPVRADGQMFAILRRR